MPSKGIRLVMKKRFRWLSCSFLLCLLSFQLSFAQKSQFSEQHLLDSLNAIVADPLSHDTSIASAYIALTEILYVVNIDTVLDLSESARTIAERALKNENSEIIKNSLLNSLANALHNIGYYYSQKGDITIAMDYYLQSLKIQKDIGNDIGIADGLNNIASLFERQGNIPEALERYYKALEIYEKLNEKEGIAIAFSNIGRIFEEMGDFEKGLEFLFKSLTFREEFGDKKGIATCLNNIGYNYSEQGDSSKALEYMFRAIEISKDIGYKEGLASTYGNIGFIYLQNGDREKAMEYYNKSFLIFDELDYKMGIANALINIGDAELKEGNIKSAQKYANQSLKLANEMGFPENIKNAAALLSKVYEAEERGMDALKMYKLYYAMRDSINNRESMRANAEQQVKYEYDKKKVIDDAERDKMIAIEKEEKEKQRIITFSTIGILLLVVVFLFIIFNRLKITRKQKTVIEVQKVEVEKQRDVIKVAHKEITDSISYAKRIQKAILPPDRIVKEHLGDHFILYKPKDVVAGDFYWMRKTEDKVLFAAADCTGHGVPGAMVSVVCNNALNRSVRDYGLSDPGKVLDKTREIVVREFEKSDDEVKDGMDIALCMISGNELHYAGAYNPLWIVRNGEIIEAKANRFPVGLSLNAQPYTTHTIKLEKGDVIYVFTDGFVDQFGGDDGKKFKSRQFKSVLSEIASKEMSEQKRLLDDIFEKWRGDLEQVDDVCVIGMRYSS